MDRETYEQQRAELRRQLTRREVLKLGAMGIGALGFAGFLGSCRPQGGGEGGGAGGPVEKGGTLVFGVDAIQGNFDPGIFATFGDWMAIDCIARGLTHIDYHTTEVKPALAESWEISDDQRTYTFKLRDGLTFHDGNPVTAKDAERSFIRLLDENDPSRPPGTYAIAELGGLNLKEVRAIDDRTFEMVLGVPDVAFLARLSNPNGVILSAAAIDKYGEKIGNNLVGAGPFKLVDATAGEKATLEAFEDYYEGRPPLERVVLQVLPDPSALTSALQSDQVQASNFIPHSSVARFKEGGNLQVYEPKPYIDIFLQMNAGVPLLEDIRVRQAINYALDREAIVQEAFFGLAQLPAYMVSPPELGYDESLRELSTQDMERAKQLLEEAGAVGETVSVIHQNILFWPKVGQIVNSNLEELGLKVETQYLDSGTFSERQFDPEGHEVASWQRSAFVPDPDNKLSPLLAGDSQVTESITQNQLLPTQEELDRRLVEARQETDQQKRQQMYVDLQRFLAEKIMVYSMLAYIYTPVATASNVGNFNADSLGTYRLFLEDTGFSGS
jgi:peptide/nickel transport system substrate-binding protein